VRHKNARFLDNNVLAHPHGLREIERLAATDIRVDFNQGLDARLVCKATARLLSRLRWTRYVRLACDSAARMKDVAKAVGYLRAAGGGATGNTSSMCSLPMMWKMRWNALNSSAP
jgi:hypothetical protein